MLTRRVGAVLSAAALVVAAAALPTAAHAATPQAVPAASPAKTVVINCLGKGVVKPKQISLACATDEVVFMNLKWSSWTANSAKATGTLVWNTCLPETCVDGSVVKYNAKITLGGVASGPSITVFSQLTAVFASGGGPAAADSATFTLNEVPR